MDGGLPLPRMGQGCGIGGRGTTVGLPEPPVRGTMYERFPRRSRVTMFRSFLPIRNRKVWGADRHAPPAGCFVPGKAVYLMIFECLYRGPFRMHERGRGVRAPSPFPSGAVARRRQANIMESSPTYPMLDVLRVCPVPRSFCHGTLLSAQLVVPSGRPADASAVSGEILRHHHRGIRPQ